MGLPAFIPYTELIKFLFAVGAVAVVATSLGALLRVWSWKVPRTLGMAFLGVIAAFVIVVWLFGKMASG